MGIKSWIRKRTAPRYKYKPKEKGQPVLKFSEKAKITGGFVRSDDPQVPSLRRGGGGSSPTQILKFESQKLEAQRKAMLPKQQELARQKELARKLKAQKQKVLGLLKRRTIRFRRKRIKKPIRRPGITGARPVEKKEKPYKFKDKGSPITKFLVPGVPSGLGIGVPGTGVFIGKRRTVPLRELTGRISNDLEKRGFSKKRISEILIGSDKTIDKLVGKRLPPKVVNIIKTVAKVERNLLQGALQEIEEDPEKIIVLAVSSALAPGISRVLGSTKIIQKIPSNIKAKGAKAISKFLTSVYLAQSGLEVLAEPTLEAKAKRVGRKLTGEVGPFMIGSRIGVRGLLKQQLKTELNTAVNKLPKSKQNAFKQYMKQAEVFGRYEPKVKNIKLNRIESIPSKKAQNTIRTFLKDSKGKVVVGGSVAQTGQVDVGRKLGDMDLYLEKGNPNKIAKSLTNQLKKAGVKRVSNIRNQITIGGKKAIEFHDMERLSANINQVIPTWKSSKSYIIKTPEGIKIQRVGVQAQRKVVAGFTDPKRLKTGKYKKDLKDFKTIADKIFKNAVVKSQKSLFFKKKKIKEVERIFKTKIKIKKPIKLKKPIKIKKPKVKRVIKKPVRKPSRKAIRKLLKKPKVKRVIKRKRTLSQKRFKITKGKRFLISQLPRKKLRKSPPPSYPTRPKPRKGVPPSPPPRRDSSYPSGKAPSRTPPPIKPPPTPPITLKKHKKKLIILGKKTKKLKKKRKAIPAFNVYGKSGKKFVKLNIKPLSRNDALSKGTYAIDHTTSKQFKIIPAGKKKKLGVLRPSEENYFSRRGYKLREYKVRKGRKFAINPRYIERRKFGIDTRGEKKGLHIAKFIKQQRTGKRVPRRKTTSRRIKRSPRRRIIPTQRKVLLKNLKKARAVRKSNLKKRR